jgi:hypothetical protein
MPRIETARRLAFPKYSTNQPDEVNAALRIDNVTNLSNA